ncbi:MAG: metallophosphoesterase [Pseudomonadota bacterium]
MKNKKQARKKLGVLSIVAMVTFFIIAVFFAFELYVISARQGSDEPLPSNFGNFIKNRESLEKQPDKKSFSFAVIGDTRSVGTFERLAEKLRVLPIDFAVLLGDCADNPTEDDHRYFRAECTDEFAMPFPVFYVPGNHDVSEKSFPITRFEHDYGPSIFSFEYQHCLFIFLRILGGTYPSHESIDFLNKMPEEYILKFKKRFVFMHIPPPVSSVFSAKIFDKSDELISLFKKKRIDYVLAGDYHGYARINTGQTNFIITGGGGAHLHENKHKQFNHAIVITINKDDESEWILPVDASVDIEDKIEKYAIERVWPYFSGNMFFTYTLNVIALLVMSLAVWIIFRSKK